MGRVIVTAIRKTPFIRLLIPLYSGILFAANTEISLFKSVILALLSFMSLILIYHLGKEVKTGKYSFIRGIIVFISLFMTGIVATVLNYGNLVQHSSIYGDFSGVITSVKEKNDSTYYAEIKILASKTDLLQTMRGEKIISYIKKDSIVHYPNLGDKITFRGNLIKLQSNINPFDFDYVKYLAKKQVFYQTFLNKKRYIITTNRNNSFKNKALQIREKIISIYNSSGISQQNINLLAAITLGYKDRLSFETKDNFSNSGVMHILAVSGMHVGIIWIIIKQLLFFLKYKKSTRIIRDILTIILLWCYVFITGLSPSAVRAAIMLSFIITGYLLNKNQSILNSISASAFIILIISPLLVFDTGFILSFIAITGIVIIYPGIYKLISVNNYMLRKVWEAISITIAAQISVFPLTILFFHKFPVYFLITSVVVGFVALFVIIFSFVLVLVHSLPAISYIIAEIVNYLLSFVQLFVSKISMLPMATVDNIFISKIEVFMWYSIIISAVFILLYKNSRAIFYLMLSVVMLLSYNIYSFITSARKDIFIVYKSKQTPAIQWIENNTPLWIGAFAISNNIINKANAFFHLQKNNIFYTIDDEIYNNQLYYNNGFWKTQSNSGLILDGMNYSLVSSYDTIFINSVTTTSQSVKELFQLPNYIVFTTIVLDESVSFNDYYRIKNAFKNKNIHYTKISGAFIQTK